MTADERANQIVEQHRRAILMGSRGNLEALITQHLKEAEKEAVERYLAEQERLQQVKEARCEALANARKVKAERRRRKGSN